MNLLLDTHVWIWSQRSPEKLGPLTVQALTSEVNRIRIASVSVLEAARLGAAGRIRFSAELSRWVRDSFDELAAESVPMTNDIAIEAYQLPEPFNKDPADRILVATARVSDCVLVTADERILQCGAVRTLDARK